MRKFRVLLVECSRRNARQIIAALRFEQKALTSIRRYRDLDIRNLTGESWMELVFGMENEKA